MRKKHTIIGLRATGIEVAKRTKAFGVYITAVTKYPDSKKGRRIDNNNNNNDDNNNKWNYFINTIHIEYKLYQIHSLMQNLHFNPYTPN